MRVTSKICPTCARRLPLASFYRNRSRPDGFGAQCRSCVLRAKRDARGAPRRRPTAVRTENGKECPRCAEYKPWSGYARKAAAGDQHQTYCAVCSCELATESRERHAEARSARHAERLLVALSDPDRVKSCRSCGETKPRSQFYVHRSTSDGRASTCRVCARAQARRRYGDPDHQSGLELRRTEARLAKYGLSQLAHAQLYAAQDSCCAICDARPVEGLVVDHDHQTGLVRGLLCGPCNRALGGFADDAARLARAIGYLVRPPANYILGLAQGSEVTGS